MRSGILLLDKPLGVSSNAALQRVRRACGVDKAGHVGSLDPLATGMLPICLGEATKIAGDVLSGRKCYRFTVALGTRTATGDTEGAVVETAAVPVLGAEQIDSVRRRFLGRQTQVPPMYSALKRDGQPLYKLARAGVEVERAARDIELFDLTVLGFTPAGDFPAGDSLANPCWGFPRWPLGRRSVIELETVCSKGTYVRVLAEDIARALGTCGHVVALRRLYVEPFEGQPMETLESVQAARAQGSWPRVLPSDWPLGHLPKVSFDAAQVGRLQHGQAVALPPGSVAAAPRVRLYDAGGVFLGLGAADSAAVVQPRRMFVLSQPLGPAETALDPPGLSR